MRVPDSSHSLSALPIQLAAHWFGLHRSVRVRVPSVQPGAVKGDLSALAGPAALCLMVSGVTPPVGGGPSWEVGVNKQGMEGVSALSQESPAAPLIGCQGAKKIFFGGWGKSGRRGGGFRQRTSAAFHSHRSGQRWAKPAKCKITI